MEPDSDYETLRHELEDLKALYTRTLLEKNLLQRAVNHLNLHNNAHDGIVYIDSNGFVVYANPYFLRMMDIPTLPDLLDHPLPNYIWADKEDAKRLIADVRDNGFVRERELSLFDRNGNPIFAMCSSVASKTDDGTFAGMEITFCDVTSERTIQAEVLRHNTLLEAILESAPHPVLVLDASNNVLRVNLAGLALFGMASESQNLALDLLLTSAQVLPETIETLQQRLTSGKAFQSNVDIGRVSFIMHGAPIQNSYARWVLVLNDVSSMKELDTLKSQMLRMASHDLKNPLSIVISYTDMLLSLVGDEEQKAYLSSIMQSTARMTAIITDLLDLDRSQIGSLALEIIELPAFIQGIVAEYEDQAANKNLSLTLNQSTNSFSIEADPSQLREVLRNLLDNAVKYTPAGGSINVTLRHLGENACFEIADTGCGIPMSAMSRLFQPFFRARTRATINIPGTGLGLSLAKSIVEAHGGRIWVESQEGKGSTFFIEIPLVQA